MPSSSVPREEVNASVFTIFPLTLWLTFTVSAVQGAGSRDHLVVFVATMPMSEDMHERARQKQEVGPVSGYVCPVFPCGRSGHETIHMVE